MAFMRNIVVVSYDPAWPDHFEEEARLLRSALGEILADVQHVGSTSVPHLSAKPVLDIMLVVSDLSALDAHDEAMISLGYEPQGALFIPESRFFAKGGDASRTHHVHSYPTGHPEIARHLDLRDYLRCHADEADSYALLKATLAVDHRDDLPGYSQGKTPHLAQLIAKAQCWRQAARETAVG